MENQVTQDKDITVGELTDNEIKTVEKFHRQLSSHSILSIRTDDGGLDEPDSELHDSQKETITQEEALVMQKVLKAFGYTQESVDLGHETADLDKVDGRNSNYYRLSSSGSDYYYTSSRTSRYVSPGRFYVRVSEETKAKVKKVHDIILQGKLNSSVQESYSKVSEEKLNSSVEWNSLHPNDLDISIDNENAKNHSTRYPNSYSSNGKGTKFGIENPNFRDSERSLILKRTLGNASNNHAGEHIDLSRFPPRERFQELVRRALQRKKEDDWGKKQEFYTRLWQKRGNAGWLDLIFTIVGLSAFFADSGTDLKVASDHFTTGHPWWGTFTLMFVFFPTILVNVFSYFFYKEDKHHDRTPESGWKVVKISHFVQVGLVERYWRILVKGYKIKFKKLQDTYHYKLYIAMNLDIAMLQMILAFTEDAPQLVLQLYVLIRRHLVETLQTSRIQDLWTMASIFFSFISYSRAVVNYISCLRDSKKHKGVLRWYGYVSMWFWRALMFISRILVLVFFASEFHLWFFLALFLHFVIVLALMKSQKVGFFPDQKGMQVFIRVVIAYIHTFCFFVLDATQTIRWAVIFYCLTAMEAIIFSSLWFTNAYRDISLELELAGLSVIFISYVLGLLMMVIYYKFLHPKFKRPQTKWYTSAPPKEELCEEVEDAEEEEEEGDEGSSMAADDPLARDLDHLARNRASTIVKQFEVWV